MIVIPYFLSNPVSGSNYYYHVYCDPLETVEGRYIRGGIASSSGETFYYRLGAWYPVADSVAAHKIYSGGTTVSEVLPTTLGNAFVGLYGGPSVMAHAQPFVGDGSSVTQIQIYAHTVYDGGPRNVKCRIYQKLIDGSTAPDPDNDTLISTSTNSVDITTSGTWYSFNF